MTHKLIARLAKELAAKKGSHLTEETKKKISTALMHTGRSAGKASNHLVKNYGATKFKNYGSNPYSSSQSFDHVMSTSNGKKLGKDLEAQGWEKKEGFVDKQRYKDDVHHTYHHPDGGHISVYHNANGGKSGNARVTVYGDKKAKQTTIPYYD